MNLLLHEFTHILAFNKELFSKYANPITITDNQFTGASTVGYLNSFASILDV